MVSEPRARRLQLPVGMKSTVAILAATVALLGMGCGVGLDDPEGLLASGYIPATSPGGLGGVPNRGEPGAADVTGLPGAPGTTGVPGTTGLPGSPAMTPAYSGDLAAQTTEASTKSALSGDGTVAAPQDPIPAVPTTSTDAVRDPNVNGGTQPRTSPY